MAVRVTPQFEKYYPITEQARLADDDPEPIPEYHSSRKINYDLREITKDMIRSVKSQFYSLFEFSQINDVNISFEHLDECLQQFNQAKCCVWWSGHQQHFLIELLQLFKSINSQFKYSNQQIVFNLIWN